IHGIVHSENLVELYRRHFEQYFGEEESLLIEQNLSKWVGSSHGIELADHALLFRHPKDLPLDEFHLGLAPTAGGLLHIGRKHFPGSSSDQGDVNKIDITSELNLSSDELHTLLSALPPELICFGKLPAELSLSLKENGRWPLNSIEARSAYMA